jgi:threonine/homoserine/homoserine lactone efflux protein
VAAGFLALMALCMAFSYFLYKSLPAVKPYVAAVGAVYMLYLAYKTLRSKPHADGTEKEYTTVLSGVGMQFINPKGILFCITVAANFLAPYYKTFLPIAGLLMMLSTLTLVSTCSWAAFGSAFQMFISRHRTPFNIVMALLLVYCAVSLFL